MRSARRRLLRLYARLPEFKCVQGCHACCGPVPWSPLELGMITVWLSEHGMEIKQVGADLRCPYTSPSGCLIYPVRPFLCRLYGCVRKMACPHGRGPARLLIPSAEASLLREYMVAWSWEPVRLL